MKSTFLARFVFNLTCLAFVAGLLHLLSAVAEEPANHADFVADGGKNSVDGSHLMPAQKEVLKFTSAGLQPQTLHLKNMDSSVFFVNATDDSLVSISVDFGSRRHHCASENLKFDAGKLVSARPIAPKDFAITCFPESGTYKVEAYGIKKDGSAMVGDIIVE